MQKIWLIVIICLIGAIGLLSFYKLHTQQFPVVSPEESLLVDAAVWYPSAPWSTPTKDTQTTFYGTVGGESIQAKVVTKQPRLDHFEIPSELTKMGFAQDNNLSADGPGASSWGYSKKDASGLHVLIFSYKVAPSSTDPNQPLQFTCPCNTTVTVFAGTSTKTPSSTTGLANPASVNCTQKGGTLLIKKRGDGGEYGLCDFGDNMECEEWALFRGDCPVGGRKTTGFDTIEEKYCAWLGGTTYAVANATCQLPNEHTCSDIALYNGTCQ